MEGTVICANRADALVTRTAGFARNVGEDTGVDGIGEVSFCALSVKVDFDGGGLAGLGALEETGFAATLAGVFVVGLVASFFAGTGFLEATLAGAFELVFAVVLDTGFFTTTFFAAALGAAALVALADAVDFFAAGLAADLAVGFTDAAFLGAALTVLDTAGLALADLTLDGRDDTDLADLAFT